MKFSTIEAIKEVLRLALFGAVAFIISAVLAKLELMEQNDLLIILVTLLLKGADKWLHKSGVIHGLARF